MTLPYLKQQYQETILAQLKEELGCKSVMQVPKLKKIAINRGLGAATGNPKLIEESVRELTMITGQKAVITKAKKAISNFKLREKMPIGVRVTLRGNRMYEFLHRLINIALPRVRDFRGISEKAFDKHGNYTMGVKEQAIFPEIKLEQVTRTMGFDITLVTTAKGPKQSYALLKAFGLPFQNKNN